MGQRPPEGDLTRERAFGEVVQRYSGMLTTFLSRYLGHVEQARDLVQETFLDAWRVAQAGRDPFANGDNDGIRRWLYHAAYNKANSLLRRQKIIRWESLTPLLDAETLSDETSALSFEDRIAETELMRAALAHLSQTDIACLLLRVIEGFEYAEIAAIMNATPDAVMRRLSRAKQRLRAAYLAHLQPIQE